MAEISMLALNAEENTTRFCYGCSTLKLAIDFTEDRCWFCLNLAQIAQAAEERRAALVAREREVTKQALLKLVKNHRSEFDAFMTEERFRLSLTVNENADVGWSEIP